MREIKNQCFTFNTFKCFGCSKKDKLVVKLQGALAETLGQNDVLRTRVCELEAWVNKVNDKSSNKDHRIKDLRQRVWKESRAITDKSK